MIFDQCTIMIIDQCINMIIRRMYILYDMNDCHEFRQFFASFVNMSEKKG